MDIVEAQIQAYRVVRDQWLLNPEDAYKSGQGVVLHVNDNMPDDMDLTRAFYQGTGVDINPGMFSLLEMLDKDETDAGGLNQEIFGSDDSGADVPAILGRFRTGQALTGQQGMFEGFREGKSQLGIKLVKLNQRNYTPQKVAEIINEWPTPSFYDDNLTRFDCVPAEGLLTDNQQELFYIHLQNLRASDPAAAQLIPLSEMIRYSPTPFKKYLAEIIKRGEQQMAQAQQQQQADQQRMSQLMEAQAAEDIAQAEESRTGAAYDRARTAAEIADLQSKPYLDLIGKAIDLEKVRAQKQTAVRAKVKK
jgi:hypothetical protein